MRGRTLNDSFVVLDEAQNTTPEQMKMFLTRLGFGTRMVVTGDITQVDLPQGTSGLRLVTRVLERHRGHPLRETLTSDDVVRHTLVGRIVDAYSEYDERRLAARRERDEARNSPGAPNADVPDPGPGTTRSPSEARTTMSIEIGNESGIDIDETVLLRLTEHNLAHLNVQRRRGRRDPPRRRGRDGSSARAVDGRAGPTDVLSFPMDELRPGTEDAADAGRPARRHRAVPSGGRDAGRRRRSTPRWMSCVLPTTHGLLHLLGFDHAEPDEEPRDVRSAERAHPQASRPTERHRPRRMTAFPPPAGRPAARRIRLPAWPRPMRRSP